MHINEPGHFSEKTPSNISPDTLILAQLLWLERPTLDDFTNRWDVHVLKDGACDTNLAEASLSNGGLQNFDVIFATGYYTYKLVFFWSTNIGNNWNDPNDASCNSVQSTHAVTLLRHRSLQHRCL